MRGDLVLYKSTGKWYERLIAYATRGDFVHVAIVVGADAVIAARSSGIGYEQAPHEGNLHATISLAPYTTPEDIERGLTWAIQQLGEKYSWLDIAYQACKLLWPHNPLRFSLARHMDCSEYATRYLLQAGVILPPAFDDPATITPNDLARWAGILAPPKAT